MFFSSPKLQYTKSAGAGSFFHKKWFMLSLWLAIATIFYLQGLLTYRYNNYLIFENTFHNLIHQQSLYAPYPAIHSDVNHYGPVFALFIAPFALFPPSIGLLLWNLANAFLLYQAIVSLPINNADRTRILYIAIPCLITSMLSEQYNPIASSLIILSFVCSIRNKSIWSAFFIMLGTFIKLYGIMGLAFFFFIKNKKQFVLACIFWAAFFFVLPMLFSSPQFIFQTYIDWFKELSIKNKANIIGSGTDISIMGFVRDVFRVSYIPNFVFLTFGSLLFVIPYLRFRLYNNQQFQLFILASSLLFPVLFSTGAEDVTYVISIIGVGLWYIFEKSKKMKLYLSCFLIFILSDLIKVIVPNLYDNTKILHSIYSLPFFLIWLRILYNASVMEFEEIRQWQLKLKTV